MSDTGRFEVWVNGAPVRPQYVDVNKAMRRAEAEAKERMYVQVVRVFVADKPPKSVATWTNGKRH